MGRTPGRRPRRRRASLRPWTRSSLGLVEHGPAGRGVRGGASPSSRAASTRSRSPTGRPRCTSRCSPRGAAPATRSSCPRSTSSPPRTRSRTPERRPVFCDISGRDDLNLDPADLEAAITPRTKAVVVLHYGGYPCDMDAVREIAERRGLIVIEDAAHAPGATWHGRAVRVARRASAASASSRTRTCRSARAG